MTGLDFGVVHPRRRTLGPSGSSRTFKATRSSPPAPLVLPTPSATPTPHPRSSASPARPDSRARSLAPAGRDRPLRHARGGWPGQRSCQCQSVTRARKPGPQPEPAAQSPSNPMRSAPQGLCPGDSRGRSRPMPHRHSSRRCRLQGLESAVRSPAHPPAPADWLAGHPDQSPGPAAPPRSCPGPPGAQPTTPPPPSSRRRP